MKEATLRNNLKPGPPDPDSLLANAFRGEEHDIISILFLWILCNIYNISIGNKIYYYNRQLDIKRIISYIEKRRHLVDINKYERMTAERAAEVRKMADDFASRR